MLEQGAGPFYQTSVRCDIRNTGDLATHATLITMPGIELSKINLRRIQRIIQHADIYCTDHDYSRLLRHFHFNDTTDRPICHRSKPSSRHRPASHSGNVSPRRPGLRRAEI